MIKGQRYLSCIATVSGLLFCGGCATIFARDKTTVKFDSDPQNAYVLIDGQTVARTPATYEFPNSGYRNTVIEIKKDGYHDERINVHRSISGLWLTLDLLASLPTLGMSIIVDGATGAFYQPDVPKEIRSVLRPKPTAPGAASSESEAALQTIETKPAGAPTQPSRKDVQESMDAVRPGVDACYDRFKVPGIVSLQLRVGPDGRVMDSKIQGNFAGTPTGDCVAEAGNHARFPQFDGPPMSFTYPFVLH